MWDSILADNVSLDEIHAFHLDDHGERYGLHPLGEVADHHNGKFGFYPSSGEQADQVYSQFCEWPGANDGREQFGGLSHDMGESLALVTLPNKIR